MLHVTEPPLVGLKCCLFLVSFLAKQTSCCRGEIWLHYYDCFVTVCVLCRFRIVPLFGQQSVIVTFLGQTYLPNEP